MTTMIAKLIEHKRAHLRELVVAAAKGTDLFPDDVCETCSLVGMPIDKFQDLAARLERRFKAVADLKDADLRQNELAAAKERIDEAETALEQVQAAARQAIAKAVEQRDQAIAAQDRLSSKQMDLRGRAEKAMKETADAGIAEQIRDIGEQIAGLQRGIASAERQRPQWEKQLAASKAMVANLQQLVADLEAGRTERFAGSDVPGLADVREKLADEQGEIARFQSLLGDANRARKTIAELGAEAEALRAKLADPIDGMAW